ncbi:MAG: hypothetical protein ACOZNI_29840 [Myxococcota bacterium]
MLWLFSLACVPRLVEGDYEFKFDDVEDGCGFGLSEDDATTITIEVSWDGRVLVLEPEDGDEMELEPDSPGTYTWEDDESAPVDDACDLIGENEAEATVDSSTEFTLEQSSHISLEGACDAYEDEIDAPCTLTLTGSGELDE